MSEIVVSTEIEASPEAVWRVLTDLDHFAEWNPFICDARGAVRAGATLRVRVRPSPPVPQVSFRPEVTACVENREIRWRGRFLASWLGRGEHTFAIEPIGPKRVRFVQRETFAGLLPRLAAGLLERETRRGFEVMNRALKERSEGAQSAAERAACRPAAGDAG